MLYDSDGGALRVSFQRARDVSRCSRFRKSSRFRLRKPMPNSRLSYGAPRLTARNVYTSSYGIYVS